MSQSISDFLAPPKPLGPRLGQTLALLLEGDGEKQVAGKLGISLHTAHIYVKALYRLFEVNSRGELLAWHLRGLAARLMELEKKGLRAILPALNWRTARVN